MKRRSFFRNASLAALGSGLISPVRSFATDNDHQDFYKGKTARNIIFLVSDGMSIGTLSMANLLLQRQTGRQCTWIEWYEQRKLQRSLMDTASASSLVTDSSAASSAWGGGVRVNNGSLNVGPDGKWYKPILQKFKDAGKSVGCVTTVPIAHATPAGFCVNNGSRGDLDEISAQYLPLQFDVMMGGGLDNFLPTTRKDKKDLFSEFEQKGYTVTRSRSDMLEAAGGLPLIGAFYENGLPYTVDRNQDASLQQQVPTLAEMTQKAISLLSKNKKGFALQVEGGKVDWGAHANDSAGLLYDQIAFDEAVKVALEFAEADKQTLVIITTDHGNANPGIFSASGLNGKFDRLQQFKHSNDWILNGITNQFSVAQVRERIEAAQSIAITNEEAASLLSHYTKADETGIYNPRNLPFKQLAMIQSQYTGISWASMDHSGDHVELAAYGPGSNLIKPFVKNTDLHYIMLQAAEVENKQ